METILFYEVTLLWWRGKPIYGSPKIWVQHHICFILDLARCHCERFTWIYACTYSFLFFANLTLFHNKITSNQIRKVEIVKHKSLMVDGRWKIANSRDYYRYVRRRMYVFVCICKYVSCLLTHMTNGWDVWGDEVKIRAWREYGSDTNWNWFPIPLCH